MDVIRQTKQDWDDLAELDAAWFNFPSGQRTNQEWDRDAFFQSGRGYVKRIQGQLQRLDIRIGRDVAVDFGCGIGRVTQALAEEFAVTHGIDISERMVAVAESFNRHGARCRYRVNLAADLGLLDSGSVDLVFSNNALQHNPPDVIRNYLAEFARVLKDPGVMAFQIPIEHVYVDHSSTRIKKLFKLHPKRVWNKLRGILIGHGQSDRYYRLRRLGLPKKWLFTRFGLRPHINMYCISEAELRALLASHGFVIREIERYQYENLLHARILAARS